MKKITLLITLMISSLGFSQNLITNGDFESGSTGWSGNALNVVTEGLNSYSSANVAVAGAAYAVNLSYGLPLTQGTSYKLTFDAWSDTNRTLIAGIGLYQDPWTNTTETVNLTTTSQTFVLNFTANFASPTSRIIFDMGAATGFVGIDNVILEEVIPIPSNNQVLIEDFETPANYTYAGFEGLSSASIATDPSSGASNLNGLQLISSSAGNPWQGAEVVLKSGAIKLTTDKTVKVDVYATQAFTMLGKVEMGASGAPNSAAAASYTTPNTWQTLTFTFNESLDNTGIANGEYSKIVFFPNWNGNFGTPASNFTINVDNITAEKAAIISDPTPLTAAPVPPARNAGDVISLFSNAYSNTTIDNWAAAPIWYAPTGKAPVDVLVESNDTKKIAFPGFMGVDFSTLANHVDLTSMERFHMDIWTETATLDKSFNLKLVNFKGDNSGELNFTEFSTTNASNPALPNPNPGTWISLDMPLSAWTAGANGIRNNIAQFVVTSDLGTVYFDNVYLYKGTALGTTKFEKSSLKVYPNPATSNLTVEANKAIERISVHNVLGQEVLSRSPKTNNTTLDISNLQKGTYIVRTTSEGATETTKVIKK